MVDIKKLYKPWWKKGSYFNLMIECGRYNQWVQNALEYLPTKVLDDIKENILFISTVDLDACRVARKYCETRELILLSERILPKAGADEGQAEVRYFIFAVLHEVVHAIKKHKSKKFNSLSDAEDRAQENEADSIAIEWFNQHVIELNNPYANQITLAEIDEMRRKNQIIREKLYTGR